VFLTTQYLEEADVLANRLGIIDHGRIVAEGTPPELKAEIGRPTVEAVPSDPGQRDAAASVLARFGDPCAAGTSKDTRVAVRLRGSGANLAEVVRALDAESIDVDNLELHQPTLDDVFLTKTGRSLEGAGDDEDEGEEDARRAGEAEAVPA
jgi:ABC-2 type transport system ATP-binding protein